MIFNHPHLEVIVGPMFSGKTTELMRRLRRAQIAGLSTILLRPDIDHTALTHDGGEGTIMTAFVPDGPVDLFSLTQGVDVVGIDEAQFLPRICVNLPETAKERIVIVAALDTTYRYEPWPDIPRLMSYAEKVDKLTAICVKCGGEGTRTQRMVNGLPAKATDPTILVGEEDYYEARCSRCWELDLSSTPDLVDSLETLHLPLKEDWF